MDTAMNLSGLGNLSDLLAGGEVQQKQSIELHLIDEDPNQPRKAENPGFSEESLKELAATIATRGVKSPISVRENGDGRFTINHGARRFRASKIAGLSNIPAFIDNDYNESDQVIENLQRNALTAREIADYIGRQKASGETGKQIASALGKSTAWVSQHAALLDLPDCLAEAFSSGRLRDVTVTNDLLKLWKKFPEEVESWLAEEQDDISRSAVKTFADYLAQRDASNGGEEGNHSDGGEEDPGEPTSPKEPKEKDTTKFKKAIVLIEYESRPGRILLTKRPEVPGGVWIKYDDDGSELEVTASDIVIRELIEG